MHKSFGRSAGRHLADVGRRHGSVEVFRLTSNKDRKEIATQSLVSRTST
jgi:hypothetical protein